MTTQTLLSILVGYLIGAIPFTFIIAKWRGGIDLRTSGSKNVGGRNLARHFGWGWGSFGAFLDFLKGALAVILSSQLFGQSPPQLYFAAAAAVAGHNWPVYLRFHGGKGLAAAGGALFALAPEPAIAGAIGAALFLWIFKHPIAAGLFGFVGVGLAAPIFDYAQDIIWFTVVLFLVALAAMVQERFSGRRDPAIE